MCSRLCQTSNVIGSQIPKNVRIDLSGNENGKGLGLRHKVDLIGRVFGTGRSIVTQKGGVTGLRKRRRMMERY